MTKIGFLLILFFISTLTFSQTTETQDFERLDVEKIKNDLKIIQTEVDSTFFYIKGTCSIVKEGAKIVGWRKTILIIFDTIEPYVLFLVLYIVWLIRRKQ